MNEGDDAKLDDAKLDDAKLDEAKLDDAKLGEGKRGESKLDDAKLNDAKLDDVEPKKPAPKRGEDAREFNLEEMRGARVVVRANGFIYRGVLVGADENDLYLKGELRYLVLPLSNVTSLELERPSAHLGLPPGFDKP